MCRSFDVPGMTPHLIVPTLSLTRHIIFALVCTLQFCTHVHDHTAMQLFVAVTAMAVTIGLTSAQSK